MDKITIVVPCFNEEEALPLFYKEIKKVLLQLEKKNVETEIIFINDGSSDDTINIIKNLNKKEKNINYISFSRNFGKEAAMYAGFSKATGDYVAVMDADLQDPPQMLVDMYNIIKKEDYDCVACKRKNRNGEPCLRNLFTKCFYHLIRKISRIEMVDNARDFRLMKMKMIKAIIAMNEYNRYSKGIFSFVGFKTKWLEYNNKQRVAGKTKFNFFKLLFYAFDGIIAFSTAPLWVATFVGILFCLISFIMIIVIIIKTLIWHDPTSGWPSIVCIMFFLSGIQLFCTGVIGAYLSKTYLETKKRPLYIVAEASKKDYE